MHAVLVHEGQANAGHYWAYIYDHHQNRWMKYNDISVTKSTWEELERDSFGGYRNASAYCLMYINDKEQYLIQGNVIDSDSAWYTVAEYTGKGSFFQMDFQIFAMFLIVIESFIPASNI